MVSDCQACHYIIQTHMEPLCFKNTAVFHEILMVDLNIDNRKIKYVTVDVVCILIIF